MAELVHVTPDRHPDQMARHPPTLPVMMATFASHKTWHRLVSQFIGWLCCALMVVVPVLPALGGAFVPAPIVDPDETESEERLPVQDEDDSTESGTVSSSVISKNERKRRHFLSLVVPFRWLTHSPHPHQSQSGHALPICTPFSHGVNLPLRC